MSLSPLSPRESAVDACAHAIRDAILRGELGPGAQLPPERQLAETLGVSRLTLRAGLAKVATTGLLTVKHGRGYRVQDFRRRGGPELLPGLAELAATRADLVAIAADLLRVRRHLARAVLERLAELGPAPATAFAACVEAFADAAERGAGPAEIAAADLQIVAALLDETRSPVLALCMNPITAVVGTLPALRDAIYAEPRSNADGWRMLGAWLQTRRADLIEVIVTELERRDRETLRRLDSKRRSSR